MNTPPAAILTQEMCDEARSLLPLDRIFTKIEQKCNSWVVWGISTTRVNWRVRKAGVYAAKCIAFAVLGSGELAIDPEGFENLYNPGGVDPIIDTYYGVTSLCQPVGVEEVNWMTPEELNNHDIQLSGTLWWRAWWLWNKIVVKESNTAGEYSDEALITLTLSNLHTFAEEGERRELEIIIPRGMEKSIR